MTKETAKNMLDDVIGALVIVTKKNVSENPRELFGICTGYDATYIKLQPSVEPVASQNESVMVEYLLKYATEGKTKHINEHEYMVPRSDIGPIEVVYSKDALDKLKKKQTK